MIIVLPIFGSEMKTFYEIPNRRRLRIQEKISHALNN